MKLNGWQRLLVVVTALWTIPVVTLTGSEYGKISSAKIDWYRLAKEIEHYEKKGKWPEGMLIWHDEIIPSTSESKKIYQTYKSEKNQRTNLAPRGATLSKEIESLARIERNTRKRKETLLLGFGFLIIPPVFLYLLGISIAWIIRGFKGGKQ